MAGIAKALRYLNSVELVVSIQRFFGVEQITVEQINGKHSAADSQTEKFTNGDAGGCSPYQRHYSLRSASQSKKFDSHETTIANGDVRHRGKEETDIDNNTISVSKTINSNLSHTNGYAIGVSVPKSGKHKNFSGILHDVANTIHSKVGPKAVTDNELTEKHVAQDSKTTPIKYKINNVFYYLLFSFGAGLGNDFFYITYFPFCLWNLDSYITRRVCLGWYMLMYLGQASKDIIRWPRPKSPPTVRLELRYELEYGMPSTHAIVGSALPFTFLFLAQERFEVSSPLDGLSR